MARGSAAIHAIGNVRRTDVILQTKVQNWNMCTRDNGFTASAMGSEGGRDVTLASGADCAFLHTVSANDGRIEHVTYRAALLHT